MSILSALKARGAKGKNIEEAVKTLPIGGGSGGGVLVVNATTEGQTKTFDHTWQEIHDAPIAVMSLENGTYKTLYVVEETGVEDGDYWLNIVALNDIANPVEFDADSADGHPSATMG